MRTPHDGRDDESTARTQATGLRFIADTLSGRLALVFTLLVLPPTIVSLHLAWDSYLEQKARAKLQVRQFATLTATYESKFFDDVQKILQRLGDEEVIRNGGGAGCDAVIEAALQRTPEFASLGYFDTEGRRLCGPDNAFADVSNRGWFREVRGFRGFAISDYTVPPSSRHPVIVAAQAVYGGNYQFQGVLAASIRLYWLSAFIREVSLPVESVFYLIDRNGNILADRAALRDQPGETAAAEPAATPSPATTATPAPATMPAASGLQSLASVVGNDLAAAVLSRRLTDFEAAGPDSERRVFSSVALPHGDVAVLFGMPAISALGGVEKDLINRVLGLAAIWLAGVVAAWLGTRYLVTRWISRLRGMARAFGQGSYAEGPDFAQAPRELRDLGETLSLMAHRIEVREEELRTSLHQKDIILREIHHRVKNNLQIVSSLLNIRGGAPGAGEVALAEVKAHVRALALVHRHLYESDDVQRVDLRSFMTELCQSMLAVLSGPSRRVLLDIDIPSFMIATDRAIPLALLVTEAMTNSLKHAFPDGRRGRITVSFTSEAQRADHGADGEAGTLTVADDGVGMPAVRAHAGIGLQLIEAFAKQIDGELDIAGPPGTVIRVRLARPGCQPSAPGAESAPDSAGRPDAA
ncbi:MAG TPA: sensor histidine kinase [Thermohalobaculum sp.]|nr:sensor histidine kinase [Thermohalobaculum sp.]